MRRGKERGMRWDLLPLIALFVLLPLVVRMQLMDNLLKEYPWFPGDGQRGDFFFFFFSRFLQVLAVWVLLQFIDHVEPMAHYPAASPSQIFFLKENMGYEIVVLYDGEQHLARLLQPQEDLRYIFVLPRISMAQQLVLPNVPCLFATVDYNGQEIPTVKFYTEEGGAQNGSD